MSSNSPTRISRRVEKQDESYASHETLLRGAVVESQEGLKPLTEWDNVNYSPLLSRRGRSRRGPPRRLWWRGTFLRSSSGAPGLAAVLKPRGGRPLAPAKSSTTASVYTGASSPSFLSSFLSALCAAGHTQASVEAASSIIASASQVRIFQRGLSLQRLATYSAAASALAS
jgi:hypothetical protein